MKTAMILGVLTIVLGFLFFSPDARSKGEDMADKFRCEKFSESGMGALKGKLLENCNLDKPFSFTSHGGLGDSFSYCCHIKK